MVTEKFIQELVDAGVVGGGGGFKEYETLADAIENAKSTIRIVAYETSGSYPGYAMADVPAMFMNGEVETPVNFEFYGGDSDKYYIRMTKQAGGMWSKYYAYYSTNRTSYCTWKYYAS